METQDIKKKFKEMTSNVSIEVWWDWVKSWISVEAIVEQYNNWDETNLKEEIEKLQKLQNEHDRSVVLTNVTKNDILTLYQDDDLEKEKFENISKKIESLNHKDLTEIAEEIIEYLCDSQSYWYALKEAFEKRLENET